MTTDSDVMNARYCPKCDVTQTIPKSKNADEAATVGAVAWVAKDDPMFRDDWSATTPLLYRQEKSAFAPQGLVPLFTHPHDASAMEAEIADLESDIDTLADHNLALQQVIRDAVQAHREFNTTTDMADWLREALERAALPSPPKGAT